MFYSRQLLARKTPLGQIWRAATTHIKINRRKLNKLDIIKICEEILNPSVPMALRLSGILMGGVVIVYEQKVKMLHDDVNRFLIEINNAWKVKAVSDPTLLPKGKSQAKKEAVTLPDNPDTDFGETEQSLNFSNFNAAMGFQETTYFAMQLDSIDEALINGDARDDDPSERLHQAEPEDITLCEPFDPYQANATMYNRDERFDVEVDDGMQFNFPSGEHTQIPTTTIPSPPPQQEPQRAYEIHNENLEARVDQKDEHREVGLGPRKRKTRRKPACLMDDEHTVIPAHVYQSWLQNASDLVSRARRRKGKGKHSSISSTVKIANLMELPPTVLMDDLFHKNGEVYYPPPLMELWRKSNLPSRRTSPPLPPEASEFTLHERQNFPNPMDLFEDFHSGVGVGSQQPSSFERQREVINDISHDLFAKFKEAGVRVTETPSMPISGNSGDDVGSIPSSGSGHGLPSHNSEVNVGRSNNARPSSRHRGGNLGSVAEENSSHNMDPCFPTVNMDPDFNLPSVDGKNGLTPDQELLVETGPTQTQRPVLTQPIDQLTDCIKTQLKAHFDTPGAPQVESLDNLAIGMNRKGAAQFFYQTCVLATHNALRVEQRVPYGEIFISRGPKL
ncbi:hypothetical protein TIFTF001_010463 [Ficus carica]|uniref:Sister chromatid cohesion 1 protein 1 n=1 Tax=Ficus carica TaxID=3494 RepID=A0AA88DHP5_FICCA|nr:hypothetical protein TIFTF001_010463 [Ficus carica]